MAEFDYQLAANWDNAAGLANIEGISVAGAQDLSVFGLATGTHYFVSALGQYNRNEVTTIEGGIVQNGYAQITWIQSIMSVEALNYMLATYGQDSSNKGKVTVRTRTLTETYANYNAILRVVFPQTLAIEEGEGDFWYPEIQMILTLKETL